jgi:hypothetical protein
MSPFIEDEIVPSKFWAIMISKDIIWTCFSDVRLSVEMSGSLLMVFTSASLKANDSIEQFFDDMISIRVLSTGQSRLNLNGASLALFKIISSCSGVTQRIPSCIYLQLGFIYECILPTSFLFP